MDMKFRFNLPEFFEHMSKKGFDESTISMMKENILDLMKQLWHLSIKVPKYHHIIST